jgi:hypothetical protein
MFIVGCYIEPGNSTDGTIILELSGQDLQTGYSGGFIRVSFYLADSLSSIEFMEVGPVPVDVPYWFNGQEFLLNPNYMIVSSLPPVPFDGKIYEDFPIEWEQYSGTINVSGLVPGIEYQLIVEMLEVYYEEEEASLNPFNYAGISDPFTVGAGENTIVSIMFNNYNV